MDEGLGMNNMDEERELAEFEERLGRALHRVDTPAGFADRVMQRTIASPKPAVHVMPRRWVTYGALAAMLLASVAGEWGYRVHEQQKRERVERDFETAMRVTGETLQKTSEQLRRAGVVLGD